MSYRTTSNMKKIINRHNKKILNKNEEMNNENCNCSEPPCPLQGYCQTKNMVYQGTVKTNEETECYIGLTATSFKKRLANHETSFRYSNKRGSTTLANHIWTIKDQGGEYELKWKLIGRAQPFSPISRIFNLCTLEKYYIIFKSHMATLNKKEEINNWCPHKKQMLLDKT